MTPRGRHMGVALVVAAALHVAAAVALWWRAPDPGAAATGIGGIEISLGPAGAAAGAAPTVAAAVPEPPPVPELPPPEPEPVVQPEPPPEPVPPPEVTEAVPVETPEPEPKKIEPPPEPEPKPLPKPKKVQTPRERLAHVRPPPVRPTPPKPPEPVRDPPPEQPPEKAPEPVEAPDAVASAPGNQGKAGSGQTEAAGSATAQTAGGVPGASADYLAVLRAWLERYKEYPRRARLRRQEGVVVLRFAMNGAGSVLSYRIERSSGIAALDQAVEQMIVRAQPLPKVPADMGAGPIELVIPVQFYLR